MKIQGYKLWWDHNNLKKTQCDVGTAQCENCIVKCEKKKLKYHQMWEKYS